MATYAIGDIQGCYYAFQSLLERIGFDVKSDELWLVGDIVNRGSGSLEVLRWCFQHQEHLKIVLGNHDLHTIAVAHGIRPPNKSDTIQSILDAPDADDLLNWLRHQPLMVKNNQYMMVHAGLLPQWQAEAAFGYAKEVETALQSNNYMDFLCNMYGNSPNIWMDDLTGFDRLRVITNAMTRIRVCAADGALDFNFKGELPDVPEGYVAWFDWPDRASDSQPIIFGHWSALGLQQRNNVFALDTGCLWGGALTAMCLETKQIIQVPSNLKDKPRKVHH
jgi:bis(5'-nucleosyl)-tetraphosphatase (symmetrical)